MEARVGIEIGPESTKFAQLFSRIPPDTPKAPPSLSCCSGYLAATIIDRIKRNLAQMLFQHCTFDEVCTLHTCTATQLIGNDAFQECDVLGVTRPICKHSYLIKDSSEVPEVVAEAFHIASTGRPGPVVIDFAKDAQFAE